jgi:hypothetical protein
VLGRQHSKNALLRRRYPQSFLAPNETKYFIPEYLETALLSYKKSRLESFAPCLLELLNTHND